MIGTRWAFLSFLFVSICFAQNKQDKIIGVVEQEIKEISRLYEQTGKKDGELLLRLAELLLEKTKLLRDEENERYLNMDPEKRSNISKASFFSKSQASLEQSRKICNLLLKNHPQYKNKAEVFSILAHYDREHNNVKGTEENLKKATELSPDNSPQKLQNMLALAETLYNKEKYSEAIPLYEKSLSKLQHKWWTKDAYNLAWCYLRTGDASAALKKMLEAYQKSAEAQYTNFRDQIVKDIGLFYLEAGKGGEAISFYQNENVPFFKAIERIHKKLQGQGRYAQAEKIVDQALATDSSQETQSNLLVLKLETYSHTQKITQHLATVKKLLPYYKQGFLGQELSAQFVDGVNRMSLQLQKEALEEGEKTRKADYVEQYLLIKKEINPKNNGESDLLIGEAYYVKKDYEKAYTYYYQSAQSGVNGSEQEKKWGLQSIESMINVLGLAAVSEEFKKKHLSETYVLYLKYNPRGIKSISVYQKLFNVYFDERKLENCEKLVDAFKENFQNEPKVFEGLVLRLIDLSSQIKRKEKLNDYVVKVVSKIWPVSEASQQKAQELLATLQIENVQQRLKKGNKESALEGYLQVYDDPKSTPKAKKNSAYNIAVIYYEWDRPKEAVIWGKLALTLMDSKEINKYLDTFLAISNLAYESFNYGQSIEMSFHTYKQICHEDIEQKNQLFKNAFLLSLAVGQPQLAEGLRHLAQKCGVNKKDYHESTVRMIESYKKDEKWLNLEKLIEENENEPTLFSSFLGVAPALLKAYERSQQEDRQKLLNKKIKNWLAGVSSKDAVLDVEAQHLALVPSLEVWNKTYFETKNLKFSFPEDHFNKQVKEQLGNLARLTEELKKIQGIASADDLVSLSLDLISLFRSVAKQLSEFNPTDKSPEYIASFKNAIKETTDALLSQANFLKNELKTTINDKGILSKKSQKLFWSDLYPVVPYMSSKDLYYWMDRGGRK